MSINVLISTLNGDDLPEGWSHKSNNNCSAFAPDSFWEKLDTHPSAIRERKRIAEQVRQRRIKSLRINGTPQEWGIS